MKYELKLTVNDGFGWYEMGGIHFKGYFYINGRHAEPSDVFSCLTGIKSKSDFSDRLKSLNGCFSIIVEKEDGIFAASDKQGSFPVFYAIKENTLYIYDDANKIVKDTGFNKINHTALIDYLHFECTMYNDTLADKIYMIPAMNYIYADGSMETPDYIKYLTIYEKDYLIDDKELAEKAIDYAFKSASIRLAESLGGRTAAVSLSGGVDSRACLMMLKMAGYKNVVCYTYGWQKNPDSKVAEAVAGHMGYRHVFIPSDRKEWKHAYKDGYTQKFIKQSHNLSSISHMESHFTVKKLIKENIVPADSIFITGHVGVMSKTHFEEDRDYTKEEIVEKFWKYYGKLYSLRGKRKDYYTKRLSKYIGNEKTYPRRTAECIYENAGYEMCRGKHLINSHRQFEINGCEWRMPLMDYEIFSTFTSINPCVRDERKQFFSEYVINNTGCDIREAKFKKNIFAKAYRNIKNPVYSIMRPWNFLTLGYKDCLIPPFPIRQYRFIRRFYSYCALYEIRLIKKWLNLV